MVKFLSDEWLGTIGAHGLVADDLTVDITVLGGAGADTRWHVVVAQGTLSAGSGAHPGADVSLTLPYDDLVAIARGDTAPSVAFMQGRMKTAGDPGRLLDLLAATARDEYHAARDQLLTRTEF
jgi:hypothetical protein